MNVQPSTDQKEQKAMKRATAILLCAVMGLIVMAGACRRDEPASTGGTTRPANAGARLKIGVSIPAADHGLLGATPDENLPRCAVDLCHRHRTRQADRRH
jgi:hypothetical protein